MEYIEQSTEWATVANRVIDDHPELHWLKEIPIGYVVSDKAKKSKTKVTFADCNKVTDLYKFCCPYEFIIRIYEPNCCTMTEKQRYILMHHELLHIGTVNGKLTTVLHDAEEFRAIIREYGLDWIKEPDGHV